MMNKFDEYGGVHYRAELSKRLDNLYCTLAKRALWNDWMPDWMKHRLAEANGLAVWQFTEFWV